MEDKTILGLNFKDKILFIMLAAIIGSVAGFFIKILAKWAAKIPIIPFTYIWEWVAEWDSSYAPTMGIIIGIVAGIVFSINAFNEALLITVRDDAITFRSKDEKKTLSSSDIGPVYMDHKTIVILDRIGRELYRGKPEVSQYKVVDAFRHHGYPWEEQDPYYHQYIRWEPGHPDLPSQVNVMLADRKKKLKEKKEEEARSLRKVLAAEGVVIRDEKKKQYVRRVDI